MKISFCLLLGFYTYSENEVFLKEKKIINFFFAAPDIPEIKTELEITPNVKMEGIEDDANFMNIKFEDNIKTETKFEDNIKTETFVQPKNGNDRSHVILIERHNTYFSFFRSDGKDGEHHSGEYRH